MLAMSMWTLAVDLANDMLKLTIGAPKFLLEFVDGCRQPQWRSVVFFIVKKFDANNDAHDKKCDVRPAACVANQYL